MKKLSRDFEDQNKELQTKLDRTTYQAEALEQELSVAKRKNEQGEEKSKQLEVISLFLISWVLACVVINSFNIRNTPHTLVL